MQTQGPAVVLCDPTSATPSFTAPIVGPGGSLLEFSLTVGAGGLFSPPALVQVTVRNVNDPPDCSTARASQQMLWPPNHKLVPVAVIGLVDPDDDDISILVTAVTSDEPVNGTGDSDTPSDAVITQDGALLRAERAGGGNGRVYVIHFTATDELGQSCSGTVSIAVPQSRKPSTPAIDDGQSYDATSN